MHVCWGLQLGNSLHAVQWKGDHAYVYCSSLLCWRCGLHVAAIICMVVQWPSLLKSFHQIELHLLILSALFSGSNACSHVMHELLAEAAAFLSSLC